jgi:class 3 adenylate cyclase
MQRDASRLATQWRRHGFDLSAGLGVALGFATLGAIGFDTHIDYGAIGTVTNLASRLCSEAGGGEIFISHTRLDGRYVLRLAVGNVRTTEADVARAWEVLRECAR